MDTGSLSLGLAFVAGLLSFLSPCVLPLVPSFLGYVTGLTLDGLREGGPARRHTLLHAALFVLGFTLLFVALGATATALGAALRAALPVLQRVGGAAIVLFGLYLMGLLRVPALLREWRLPLAVRPAGWVGSLAAGVAFGAGWTPCVGPVLASVLLFASLEDTMVRGMLLLAAYGLGLGLPFLLAALALDRFLGGARWLHRWVVPLQRATGAALVLVGVLLLSGRFASLSAFLAQFAPPLQVAP